MVKTISRHTCEKCGRTYEDLAAAIACEAQPDPVKPCEIGGFVGGGVHGWWRGDKSWVLTMKQEDGEHHSPAYSRRGEWARCDEADAVTPGSRWFLPLWRVASMRLVSGYGRMAEGALCHRWQIGLWTPRHANAALGVCKSGGVGERLAVTYTEGHTMPVKVAEELFPTLTTEEEGRFAEVVTEAASSQVSRWPLL